LALNSRKVDLELPRFRVESKCLLSEGLQGAGVKLAFSDLADLSGIAPRLKIGKVVQKALV
jgi:serine protease inhibitor